MSTHVQLQADVVAAINAAPLEFAIEAVSSDQAYHDLEDITESFQVNVVRGGRSIVPITRGNAYQIDYALHVGIMRRWEGLTPDELQCKFDECDALLDQMWQYLMAQEIGEYQATPIAMEMVAPYSVDHRERLRQFTAEFILTIRLFEKTP